MLPSISESFPHLFYACWSVTFRKEHALGVSQHSMKKYNDKDCHNYGSLSYYEDDEMNGDKTVGYVCVCVCVYVQCFTRKTWRTETTCKIEA
jgi:hypothetical protein